MKSILNLFLYLIIFHILLCSPNCTEGINFCEQCDPLTNLCIKCEANIYIPDENGGCQYSRKCIVGNNFCLKCNEEGVLCEECENDYYPDENGGCSLVDNCEISYKGECLKCSDYFILVGNKYNLKICKSLNSEDFYNCLRIDEEKGLCNLCKERYYLTTGDKKCVETNNCTESNYGICIKCDRGFYLDKKENKCKLKNESFINCMQTIDGKICDICEEGYFLDLDNKCINTNFCEKGYKDGYCKKCIDGYYPSYYDKSCTNDENCSFGRKDIGICEICKDDYYMDNTNKKCISYTKNEDFKFCRNSNDIICYECIAGYFLGDDNKCSTSKHCAESENGKCVQCRNGFHLGLDNICSNIDHCVYTSRFVDRCIECENDLYYDTLNNMCSVAENEFQNCRSGNAYSFCHECKKDFYLNQTDDLCYSNELKGKFCKCALTDRSGEFCAKCEEDYFLSYKNKFCTLTDGCNIAQDENSCLECNEFHCLDAKTGKCEINQFIEDEKQKIYFRCNKTNEEGTSCEICKDGFGVIEDGLCIDEEHCLEKNDDGKCQKCTNDENGFYCLNDIYGCVEINQENCLECNDIFNLRKCTKCKEDYETDIEGKCIKIE